MPNKETISFLTKLFFVLVGVTVVALGGLISMFQIKDSGIIFCWGFVLRSNKNHLNEDYMSEGLTESEQFVDSSRSHILAKECGMSDMISID